MHRLTAAIAATAITLGLTLTGCASVRPTVDADAPASSAPADAAPVETSDAPEPSEAPASEAGTLANPWPVGYVATITGPGDVELYTVSFTLLDADAYPALVAANQFNEAPAEGFKYVLVQATFTSLGGEDPVMPGVESFRFQAADQTGALFQAASVVTPGETLSGAPDIYSGQSFTGQVAYAVPAGSTALFISGFGKYLAL